MEQPLEYAFKCPTMFDDYARDIAVMHSQRG